MISFFFNKLADNQHNNHIQERSRMLCTRVEPSCQLSDELSECWKSLYIGQTFCNFTQTVPDNDQQTPPAAARNCWCLLAFVGECWRLSGQCASCFRRGI